MHARRVVANRTIGLTRSGGSRLPKAQRTRLDGVVT